MEENEEIFKKVSQKTQQIAQKTQQRDKWLNKEHKRLNKETQKTQQRDTQDLTNSKKKDYLNKEALYERLQIWINTSLNLIRAFSVWAKEIWSLHGVNYLPSWNFTQIDYFCFDKSFTSYHKNFK